MNNYLTDGNIRIYSKTNYEDIHCESECIHVLNAFRDCEIANRAQQSKY